jgi:hypothetical protein
MARHGLKGPRAWGRLARPTRHPSGHRASRGDFFAKSPGKAVETLDDSGQDIA